MKRALLLILLTSSLLAYGQDSIDLAKLSDVPQLALPVLDNDKLVAKELKRREKVGSIAEFAAACKVDAGCHQSGKWSVDGDRATWKMRVKSAGAKSLNFGFTDFYLPSSASFYMTGMTSGQRRGPFFSADNDVHDQFWSPIIEDDEVLLELTVDIDQKDFVRLHLGTVNHAYFKFGSKNFSGSCNLDVICGAADGWGINDDYRDIIRSVVMYTLNGIRQCTGMLINNIRENGTPYIITADHCEVSTTNASTAVIYYNFENTSCRQPNSTASGQPGNGPLSTFNSGATWVSATTVGAGTDFNIIQLDDPINPAANAFISGWNREDNAPSSAIAIHHPSTDEKRISYENDPLQITINGGEVPNSSGRYLRVIDWDTGTTEPGSSGSPLFDPQYRFIGQLFGGNAACGNNESDWYGRLAVTWEGGGSPTTRAKDYLDPDNIKLMQMDGIEASTVAFHSTPDAYIKEVCKPASVSYTVITNANFIGSTTYSVMDNPSGVTVDVQPANASPGDPVTITLSNTASLNIGLYALRVKTEDTIGNVGELPLWFQVQDAVPGVISTIAPSDGAMYQIPRPTLSWQDAGVRYELQISTSNTFGALVASVADLEGTSWKLDQDLAANTTYYWRVRGETACDEGPWSAIAAFTTGDVPSCTIFTSSDVPKTINEPTASTITSVLNVSDPGRIAEVKVTKVKGTHSYISDLSFILISPAGTEVLLLGNICENQDDFDIAFGDDSALTNPPCPYTNGLSYKPVDPLSILQGEFAGGTWRLRIVDSADEDGGSLQEWSIEVCTVEDPNLGISASSDTIRSCTAISDVIDITAGSGFSGNVMLSIESAIGGISATLDQSSIAAGASTQLNINGTLTKDENITIRATDGTITVDKNLLLELQSSPLPPTLTTPTDMASDLSTNVALSWQEVEAATGYQYEVSTNNTFTDIVAANAITSTSAVVTLPAGDDYFWRVFAINECDMVPSEVQAFSVSNRFNVTISAASLRTCQTTAEYLVTLNSGMEGNVNAVLSNLPNGAMVSYENNPGAIGETIRISLSNIPLTAGAYDMTLALTDDIGAVDLELQLTVDEAPGLPILDTPANNMADVDTVPSFQFDLASSAMTHELEVATDVGFTDIVIQSSNITAGSVSPGVLLEPNTTYFWRVKASNSCGLSISPIYQFLTKIRTSTNDVFEAVSIQLVPNPTQNISEIVIQTTAAIRGTYHIFGVNGQLQMGGIISSSKTILDTSSLAKGMYLVRIQDDNSYKVKKLIIF